MLSLIMISKFSRRILLRMDNLRRGCNQKSASIYIMPPLPSGMQHMGMTCRLITGSGAKTTIRKCPEMLITNRLSSLRSIPTEVLQCGPNISWRTARLSRPPVRRKTVSFSPAGTPMPLSRSSSIGRILLFPRA